MAKTAKDEFRAAFDKATADYFRASEEEDLRRWQKKIHDFENWTYLEIGKRLRDAGMKEAAKLVGRWRMENLKANRHVDPKVGPG